MQIIVAAPLYAELVRICVAVAIYSSRYCAYQKKMEKIIKKYIIIINTNNKIYQKIINMYVSMYGRGGMCK